MIKSRREWLNTDKSLRAYVMMDADPSRCHSEKGKKRWGKKVLEDIYLSISDCSRHIQLEFDTGRSGWDGKFNKKVRDASIRKAKMLRSYVDEIIEELEREV